LLGGVVEERQALERSRPQVVDWQRMEDRDNRRFRVRQQHPIAMGKPAEYVETRLDRAGYRFA
jgi:hypothetical protein